MNKNVFAAIFYPSEIIFEMSDCTWKTFFRQVKKMCQRDGEKADIYYGIFGNESFDYIKTCGSIVLTADEYEKN